MLCIAVVGRSCVLLLLRVDQTISLSAHFAPSLVTQTTAILWNSFYLSGYWLKWNQHLQRIWQCCTNRRWRSRSLIVNLFTLISGVQGLLPTEPGLWLSTVIGHVHLLPRLSDQPTGRGHRVWPARARRQVEEAGGAGCGRGRCSGQELSWACYRYTCAHFSISPSRAQTSLQQTSTLDWLHYL